MQMNGCFFYLMDSVSRVGDFVVGCTYTYLPVALMQQEWQLLLCV